MKIDTSMFVCSGKNRYILCDYTCCLIFLQPNSASLCVAGCTQEHSEELDGKQTVTFLSSHSCLFSLCPPVRAGLAAERHE